MGRESATRVRANIVSWVEGGLGVDVQVVARALERAGCDVFVRGRRREPARNRVHARLRTAAAEVAARWATFTGRPLFDVTFFVESIFPRYLATGAVSALFVNPEWLRDDTVALVPKVDVLLCKTPGAVAALRDLPAPSRCVFFTSPDRRVPGARPTDPLQCLHVAGESGLKGTEAVVEAWSRHPEWPPLTVVRRAHRYDGTEAPPLPALPNVRYEATRVPDDVLREWQNACAVHVQPSQAEGYGHVIGEAMSCGAVVVTTDAPPMNELVGPDRGVLVAVARAEPMRRSARSFVDVDDLEARLAAVFAMTPDARAALGARARAWFEAQDRRFDESVRTLIEALPQPRAKDVGR